MTTAEAAKREGISRQALHLRMRKAGLKLPIEGRKGHAGRPGYRWTLADLRAARRAVGG